MKLHSVVSTLAVVAAMTLSGSALAQSMVGDVAIPEDRLGDFQAKCAAINSAATESLSEPANADDDESPTDPTATASTNPATGSTANDSPDPANEDNLDALLASMTPEQCEAAGLLSPSATVQSGGQ